MYKSKFGKETYILWQSGNGVRPEDIRLKTVQSTLQLSNTLQDIILDEWTKAKKNNPLLFDAPKWRTEFVDGNDDELKIYVSPTDYSTHNILRNVHGMVMQFYPNPLTVNTIQVTADGYILLGVKGRGSDQKGLGLMGSGFIERYVDASGVNRNPEMLGYIVQKECLEETKYNKKFSFNMEDARAISVIFGSNHDTTIGFYLPIFATKSEVSVNNNEHEDILFLPDTDSEICAFLNEGKYKGIGAADAVIGCVEAYQLYKRHKI
jgi:hypothetical protein